MKSGSTKSFAYDVWPSAPPTRDRERKVRERSGVYIACWVGDRGTEGNPEKVEKERNVGGRDESNGRWLSFSVSAPL